MAEQHPATAAPDRRRTPAARNILDVAERLAQTRGFNGFSYADVAAELLVTKASLHYHFPSKADLGCALIARYHEAFAARLDAVARVTDVRERLRRYVAAYEAVMLDDRMCLCGMLAAEFATLPDAMQRALRGFFDLNERWLAVQLDEGRRSGSFVFRETPKERARVLLGALEGGMLVARTYGDAGRFRSGAKAVLSDISAARRA